MQIVSYKSFRVRPPLKLITGIFYELNNQKMGSNLISVSKVWKMKRYAGS